MRANKLVSKYIAQGKTFFIVSDTFASDTSFTFQSLISSLKHFMGFLLDQLKVEQVLSISMASG